ncbi:unnamed protein product [Allacma fusca]|uniref:Uncharacterized protein n=1 Tax=Allacma fusca TaxID=39272 RepID=A0A8J2NM02_9HEXA|nr:unnamed protein product [Allacma fusca]
MTNDFSIKDLTCHVEYPTVGPVSPVAKENIASCRDVESQGDSRAVVVVLIEYPIFYLERASTDRTLLLPENSTASSYNTSHLFG